jgi:hypothetical protein
MKLEILNEIIKEFEYLDKNTFVLKKNRSLLEINKNLDRLFYLFKIETKQYITKVGNYPVVFKYLKEIEYELSTLLEYPNIEDILNGNRKKVLSLFSFSDKKKQKEQRAKRILLQENACLPAS